MVYFPRGVVSSVLESSRIRAYIAVLRAILPSHKKNILGYSGAP
jgi:hypothetical protein